MSSPQLSASRLELAATCPGSFAHEHVRTTNEAAERGTAVHDYLAALIEEEEALLPTDKEAGAMCRSLDREALVEAARPNVYSTLYTEMALYLSPLSGEAGVLDGAYHRDYSGAPDGSIPGTADVIAVEDTKVTVTDWKTGHREVPHPAENHQLRLLGVAASKVFDKDKAVLQIGTIRTDGSVELRSHTLEREDLDRVQAELSRVARGVQEARSGAPVYRTGTHCRYCPALPSCPAVAGAAQALMDGPPEELTDRRAAELWAQLQGVEAAAKRTREALQEYAYARPVPTSEGWRLKVVETRRETIDSQKAFHILRRHLPDEAMAEVVTITKTSLSKGLEKDASEDAMDAFREANAVNDTYSESLREVRR